MAPGEWEVIVYAAGEARDSVDTLEAPALDITYGINPTMEASLVLPYQVNDGAPVFEEQDDVVEPATRESGPGEGEIGWKWRFYDVDDKALAFTPAFAFPISKSATIRGLVDDTYVLSFPLIGSLLHGPWEFTAQVSYDWSSKLFNGISFGTSVGYQTSGPVRVLGEVWGVDYHGDDPPIGFAKWRVGFEWKLTRQFKLLGAYGGSLTSDLAPQDELKWDFYAGLQYRTN